MKGIFVVPKTTDTNLHRLIRSMIQLDCTKRFGRNNIDEILNSQFFIQFKEPFDVTNLPKEFIELRK